MSWISDVTVQLSELDTSRQSLRKFAFVVGPLFLLLAAVTWLSGFSVYGIAALLSIGSFLITAGVFYPRGLSGVFKLWMGLAFAIGWVVSRILLVTIFYLVVMPIGLVARLFGKEFLIRYGTRNSESYWVRKNNTKHCDYEKMY